jgi:hypothetical protein
MEKVGFWSRGWIVVGKLLCHATTAEVATRSTAGIGIGLIAAPQAASGVSARLAVPGLFRGLVERGFASIELQFALSEGLDPRRHDRHP